MRMPDMLARAVELELCRYEHLTMILTVPPAGGGAPAETLNLAAEEKDGIVIEHPAVNVTRISVSPATKDFAWRVFGMVWGLLTPAGVDSTFILTHGQFGMIRHDDPWIHSVVDEEYPLNLVLVKERPLIMDFTNGTAAAQTLDLTIHFLSFASEADWDLYQSMLPIPIPPVPPGEVPPDILSLLKSIDNSIKEALRGMRVISVLWKKPKETA